MQHMSMAGQIANRLEEVLDQAHRRQGLYGLPAADAECFFEDPLGALLGKSAPRCPSDPPRQPLWNAMAFGSYAVPDADVDLTFFEIVGSGGRYDLAVAAQWCFLMWVHCYQRPTARYDGFYSTLLHRHHRQCAPYGRIWGGYALLMDALAEQAQSLANVAVPVVPDDYQAYLARHSSLPAWVDALGRLGPYHDAAHSRLTVGEMLGAANVPESAEWHWESAAAAKPRPTDVRTNRVSPANYRKLVRATSLDRWMSVELNLRLDADGRLSVEP